MPSSRASIRAASRRGIDGVGGPLSEGSVEGTVVTCPLHGATFDLTTGDVTGPPAGSPVKCYEVRVEGDEIQIAAP